MDDLKVVLYVIIAIVWMIYNNYKKIGAESKKRDPSKPLPEIIEENWPGKSTNNEPQTVKEQPFESYGEPQQQAESPVHDKLKRKPLIRKGLSTKKRKEPLFLKTEEGGPLKPSKTVIFEEDEKDEHLNVNWIKIIQNQNFKHAFIMSEILRRPYS